MSHVISPVRAASRGYAIGRAFGARHRAVILFAIVALAVAILTGCSPAQVRHAVDVVEPAPAESVAPTTPLVATSERPAVVTIVNGTTDVIDVAPPQRLDVRYPGSDGIEQDHFLADCDHSGGTLVWSTAFDAAGEYVCEGVDY